MIAFTAGVFLGALLGVIIGFKLRSQSYSDGVRDGLKYGRGRERLRALMSDPALRIKFRQQYGPAETDRLEELARSDEP